MLKNVVVKDFQYIITVGGVVLGSGDLEVSTLPSSNTKVKVGSADKGVYAGPMSVTVSNYVDPSITSGTGTGIITPSASKVNVDQLPVVLEGDSGEVVLSGSNPQSGSPVTGYTVTVKIISAGQSVVKAE